MRQCLFCDKKADSKEHLWAAWILQRVMPAGPFRHSIGKGPAKLLDNAELKTRHVCRSCNGGWMSDLEAGSIPIIGSLLQDISIPLDSTQQEKIARWGVKTAMVLESVKGRSNSFFYSKAEREQVRCGASLPDQTSVWLGRYASSSLGAFGTDVWLDLPDAPKTGNGCATTIVVGHLALQVLSVRLPTELRGVNVSVSPKPGPWDRSLVGIWPAVGTASWPPPATFTNSGKSSIATLMDRWKIGASR